MATAAAAVRDRIKEYTYLWEGKDKSGKVVKGEMRAGGEAVVNSVLRRQGVTVLKIKRMKMGMGGKVSREGHHVLHPPAGDDDEVGRALLQAFDIVGKGHSNPAVARLLMDIKNEVETGNSLNAAFRKYPLHFDALFCNLVGAGEQAGILDSLLDRLATYKEKILAIKSKIKAALFYPVSIIVVAFIITRNHHDFRDPGVQGSVLELRRRPPRAYTARDGDFDLFVKWWWGNFRRCGLRCMVSSSTLGSAR